MTKAEAIAKSVHRVGRRILIDATAFDAALTDQEVPDNTRPQFISFRQLVQRHPGFTEPGLRQLVARAEKEIGKCTSK